MEARRFRRFTMPRRTPQPHTPTLLPTTHSHTHSTSTVTCCYCDYKFWTFNDPIFRLGRNHSHSLKPWFSVGVGFSLSALLAVSLLLPLTLLPHHLTTFLSFFAAPLNDAVYVVAATLVSVSVHEFGHALAAASEGIRMEYVAVFVACAFPGALVAFDDDVMQALPCFSALRVYCAGIWHNAVCCAVCGLALLLLPFMLFPFYKHGESPMVLGVPSVSPLSGYLSSGDVIVSVDGVPIRNAQEWMDMAVFLNEMSLNERNRSMDAQSVGRSGKGYCVPNPMMEECKQMLVGNNLSLCPDGLTSFTTVPCSYTSISGEDHLRNIEKTYCLDAKDVVKLNKCGDGWPPSITNDSNCICSQDESCLSPVQIPGLIWVEVTYSRPYSLECLRVRRKSFADSRNSDSMESNCGGTFVFIGDIISMARSVQLTAYQPRWAFPLGTYLPNVLERFLRCTFQVSLTLALLNSLPVYLLDGESILEASLLHFTLLSQRKRRKVVQVCLFGGTLISILAFLKIVIYGL
ncbi:PREDICTED: membrane-bound transcription factor site-2 protease-like [Fragaria vesca subsp. vesca]